MAGPAPDPRTPHPSPAPGRGTHVHKLCCSAMGLGTGRAQRCCAFTVLPHHRAAQDWGGTAKGITTPRHPLSLRSPFLGQGSEHHLQPGVCRPSTPGLAGRGRQRTPAGRATTGADTKPRGHKGAGTPQSTARAPKGPRGSEVWEHQSGARWEGPRPATHGESCHLPCLAPFGAALPTQGTETAKRGAGVAGILPPGFGTVPRSCQFTWLMEMGVWTTTPPMISVL